ncbi:zinc-dependent metalloprotease [Flavobacterium stagni]|uniref:T9SS type A sorting domain-containing protein n=1 Tax=Flavobacterium stagni TaxID=2506421 RepID=A0A4Q1K7Z2_9FLAO|nr:zinc-dependent metalloprotease [Flavobacterium stagni]RXR21958.1 T9SS type A sorting domain-containing protein [Flavobacterium stagni]
MKLRLLFALCLVQLGWAQQRTCGVDAYMEKIMENPLMKQQYMEQQEKFENELRRLVTTQLEARSGQATTASPNVTLRIPVAVHYPSVASSSSASLKDCLRSLAQTQVNILNADYNGTNADITNWAADGQFYPGTNTGMMDVQFIIATQNHPSGTGLVNGDMAVTFGTDYLSNADTDTTWAGYMNLVVRNIAGGILGYSPLGGSPSAGMTVVIDNNAFGKNMTTTPATCSGYAPSAPYNLGRTLTHELGHFFNLNHTFQACDGANCATSGDRVCDTESTSTAYYNCDPAGSVASNCTGSPQLTMNYMDYVQDSCMYMFTAGQATRMQAWYNSISSQFNMNTLGNEEVLKNQFAIAPNPNKGSFAIQFANPVSNYAMQVYDSTGRVLVDEENANNQDLVKNIQLPAAQRGVYFVTLRTQEGIVTKKVIVE